MTAATTGGLLGVAGRLVVRHGPGRTAALAVLALALVALAREAGIVAIPLPQLRRQTAGSWNRTYGPRVGAVLWGLDLGFAFTTWLNFAGVWVLALVAVVVRQPWFGAALFVAYWLGRVLSVWIAPLVTTDPTETHRLMAVLYDERALFRWSHVIALAGAACVFAFWASNGVVL